MKCLTTSCTRKTLHFKRCGLKKYGKKIRENEMLNNVIYSDFVFQTLETLSHVHSTS